MSSTAARKLSLNEKEKYAQDYTRFVLPIVRKVASRLPAHLAVEDLIQEGVAGLLEALDRFDPSQGVELKTFAARRIQGAILDALRRNDLASRGVRQRARALNEARTTLRHRLRREPSIPELAEELECSTVDVKRRTDEVARASVTSLFATTAPREGKEQVLLDTLHDFRHNTAEEAERSIQISAMMTALRGLRDREQLMLSLYYKEGLTTREIGEILGVSEARISQIHRRALGDLALTMESAGV